MNHGSLFSGIGGFDLAAQWMGWENKFHCDTNPFSRKICKYYWPNATSYDNIKTTDFRSWRGKIDVLSGGFPCQPFSTAGKRMGKEDERHLWPEMFRAIREIRPTYIVGENVRGLLSWSEGLVLEEVYADLESEGYEVETFILPAVSVNAPHKRDRVWIVAKDSNSNGRIQRGSQKEGTEVREFGNTSTGSTNRLHISEGSTTNTQCQGLEGHDRERKGLSINRSNEGLLVGTEDKLTSTNTNSTPSQCRNSQTTQGWEEERERTKSFGFDMEWEEFPTQSPVCGGDDGLPTELDDITFSKWRKESVMAYGNAIVPQIAYRIFQTIYETSQ